MDKKNRDEVFAAFTAKAVKRLQENRVRRKERIRVPSLDEKITIQSLTYPEIVECMEIEDEKDPNKADKYTIYLSVVEPDLKEVAVKLKEAGEIKEYLEVVDIFDMSEITQIATEVMKLSKVIGGKIEVINELKNS